MPFDGSFKFKISLFISVAGLLSATPWFVEAAFADDFGDGSGYGSGYRSGYGEDVERGDTSRRDASSEDSEISDFAATRRYLEEFHLDTRRALAALPIRTGESLGSIEESAWDTILRLVGPNGLLESRRQGREMLVREMLDARDAVRERICAHASHRCSTPMSSSRYSAMNEVNQIRSFFPDGGYLSSPQQMEKEQLTKSSLSVVPWTDSFWPMQKGLIGRRWRDKNAPDSRAWIDNYSYIQSFPPSAVAVDVLSPAEKYDLLVGNHAFLLTEKMWDAGRYWHERRGAVPGWAGLCHGWAPAAIMTENPARAVTLPAVDGRKVTFYPSDIKALASLAWGESAPRFHVIGSRCRVLDPREDEVGRVLDDGCVDVNPGAWHLAVVNQLGVRKRSFVFDSTYDFQVWNYPIQSYRYHYFNPQTLQVSTQFAGSAVRLGDFKIDKFKRYRSPNARFVVGIAMDLTYSIPTQPSASWVKKAASHSIKYVYDLELDAEGRIIGGEWYSNFHPDFIWSLPEDGRPVSVGELQLPSSVQWDGQTPLPPDLVEAARVSAQSGQVLSVIVDTLLRLAAPER